MSGVTCEWMRPTGEVVSADTQPLYPYVNVPVVHLLVYYARHVVKLTTCLPGYACPKIWSREHKVDIAHQMTVIESKLDLSCMIILSR